MAATPVESDTKRDRQLAEALRMPPPRPVRQTRRGRWIHAVLIVVCFGGPAIAPALALKGRWEAATLRTQGVTAVGEAGASKLEISGSAGRGGKSKWTTTPYSFKAEDGREYRFEYRRLGSHNVPQGPAEIVYLPHDPARAAPLKELQVPFSQTVEFNLCVVGAVLFGVLLFPYFLLTVPVRRRGRLLRSGVSVRGRIKSAKVGGAFWVVTYEYVVDGVAYERRSTMSLSLKSELQSGAPTLVFYDPQRPKRSDLYPAIAKSYEIALPAAGSAAAPRRVPARSA